MARRKKKANRPPKRENKNNHNDGQKELKTKETEIRNEIQNYHDKILQLTTELYGISSQTTTTARTKNVTPTTNNNGVRTVLPPANKAGYLWKWNDRQIGWGGTKWDLRFVKLNGATGELLYYRYHTTAESQPRYMANLRGCAVRDDGKKIQKKSEGFYYVFSIYHKNQKLLKAEQEDESQIVPLLRFSTESLAEKMQWIEMISEACAYCDAVQVVSSNEHLARKTTTNTTSFSSDLSTIPQPSGMVYSKSTSQMPPTRGTLPPIYFGSNYRTIARLPKAAMSNPRRTSGYPPSRPMHQSTEPSYLSEDAPEQNYRGFLNLAMIILFVSNFRLIWDSFKKHGVVFLRKPPDWKHYKEAPLSEFPLITGEILLHVCIVVCFLVEKGLARRILNETIGTTLHIVNCTLALALPIAIIWYYIPSPVIGGFLLVQSVTNWAKLVSYAHANSDYRTNNENGLQATFALISDTVEAEMVPYPGNVTLSNVYYFMYAPTLTYQIAFPRLKRVRWLRVLGLVLRMVATSAFLGFLVTQTIMPQLDAMKGRFEEGTLTNRAMVEVLLKLCIPNTYCWLAFFYLYFHLLLNLLAELLRFGDRVFYKDWWNSSEVSSYWRLWNLPVHYWLMRHIYFPAIRKGASKNMAMLFVFFLSAVLHEILISVPFHMVQTWSYSFLGMMGQVPLVALTKRLGEKFPGSSIGNVIFWITFCIIGQPTAAILYAIDYWKQGATAGYDEHKMIPCTGTGCEL